MKTFFMSSKNAAEWLGVSHSRVQKWLSEPEKVEQWGAIKAAGRWIIPFDNLSIADAWIIRHRRKGMQKDE